MLRYGLAAESLVWTFMFLMQPLACVFYPLAVLPWPPRLVAQLLPPTYVFEGLRALLTRHELRLDLMAEAFGLNILFFSAAVAGFLWLLRRARQAGSLLQSGE